MTQSEIIDAEIVATTILSDGRRAQAATCWYLGHAIYEVYAKGYYLAGSSSPYKILKPDDPARPYALCTGWTLTEPEAQEVTRRIEDWGRRRMEAIIARDRITAFRDGTFWVLEVPWHDSMTVCRAHWFTEAQKQQFAECRGHTGMFCAGDADNSEVYTKLQHPNGYSSIQRDELPTAEQVCTRNKDGWLNVYDLMTWIMTQAERDAADEVCTRNKVGWLDVCDHVTWIITQAERDAIVTEYEQYVAAWNECEDHKRQAAEAARAVIFAEAKKTGQPQVLDHWVGGCNDPREECTLDAIYLMALPDGTTRQERTHLY